MDKIYRTIIFVKFILSKSKALSKIYDVIQRQTLNKVDFSRWSHRLTGYISCRALHNYSDFIHEKIKWIKLLLGFRSRDEPNVVGFFWALLFLSDFVSFTTFFEIVEASKQFQGEGNRTKCISSYLFVQSWNLCVISLHFPLLGPWVLAHHGTNSTAGRLRAW